MAGIEGGRTAGITTHTHTRQTYTVDEILRNTRFTPAELERLIYGAPPPNRPYGYYTEYDRDYDGVPSELMQVRHYQKTTWVDDLVDFFKGKVIHQHCSKCKGRLHSYNNWLFYIPRKERKAYEKLCKKNKIPVEYLCCSCYNRITSQCYINKKRYNTRVPNTPYTSNALGGHHFYA